MTRRVGQALLTMWVASALVWALVLLAPGDPARAVLASNNINTPTRLQVATERARLGLNGSPITRYLHWLSAAARGDLGLSWVTGRPVSHELGTRLGATLVLTTAALAFSLALAFALALVSAWAPRRWPDVAARALSLGFLSMPSFLVATLLLDVVVVRGGHFRVISNGHWGTVLLPALTLSLAIGASWARILRASLLSAGTAPYVDLAVARGVGRLRRLVIHALPNSLVPFLTVMGVGIAALLGGTPIVETIFTWPGVGAFFVQSITARDLPVIQGFTLFATLTYVVLSLVVDLAATRIDPRLAVSA